MAAPVQSALTILRRREVQTRNARSRSSLYSDIAEGLFVPPVSIGARAVGWPEHEVDAIVAARIAGKNAEEVRALVKRLVAARVSLA